MPIDILHRQTRRRTTRSSSTVESLETRILMFGDHRSITNAALSFMDPTALSIVNAQHQYQDTVNTLVPSAHFDASFFAEGAAAIDGHYQAALVDAAPTQFASTAMATEFGKILHAAQDFYAHTNWVETGETQIIESSLGMWDALQPYSIHNGAMLVEGENTRPNIPGFGTARFTRKGSSHLVNVVFGNGFSLPGIISGSFGGHDNTPNTVELTHAALNKDYPNIPFYPQAFALAVTQTSHEFQRLGALIKAQYGDAGVNAFLQNWVKSDIPSQNQARALLGLPPITVASDNTLATARNLGTLSGTQTLLDFVGSSDTDDFYQFTLSARTAFTARMTGLSSDADLRLLDSGGNTIVKSSNLAASDEFIGKTLQPGSYFMRVNQWSGDTNYSLTLSAAPAAPAATVADATDLGLLAGTRSFSGAVGNAHTQDFYKFTIGSSAAFAARLTGLSADADMLLLDSSGNTIAKSSNWDTTDEMISRNLAAGTYYIQIYQYSGDSNYNLSLSA